MAPSYTIVRAPATPELQGAWNGPAWGEVPSLPIDRFHPSSSDHRPVTEAKLCYDPAAVYVLFRVRDRYVRSVHTEFMDPVCADSCVEWFVRPRPEAGYINFEINAGGALHASYVVDPTRLPEGGFVEWTPLDPDLAARLPIYHSLPAVVDPEREDETEWFIEYKVPLAVFDHYTGCGTEPAGSTWHGNLYKCGDRTSHPHWATWAPIGEELNFHAPQHFAPLHFAE
jgi:hypothetical protein